MFVVEEGRVAVGARDGGGSIASIAELGPGEFFGEMSLLTGAARSATVTAVVETRVLVIEKEALRPFLEAEPRLAEALHRFVALRDAERNRLVACDAVRSEPGPDLLQSIKDFFSL